MTAQFSRHDRKSPLTDPWEPIYRRMNHHFVTLAVHASEQHTNSRGFVHGGIIAALADNAMGLSCAAAAQNSSGGVTVNLNISYVASAQLNDWLEFETNFVKPGKTLSFAGCLVHTADRIVAHATASFMHRRKAR